MVNIRRAGLSLGLGMGRCSGKQWLCMWLFLNPDHWFLPLLPICCILCCLSSISPVRLPTITVMTWVMSLCSCASAAKSQVPPSEQEDLSIFLVSVQCFLYSEFFNVSLKNGFFPQALFSEITEIFGPQLWKMCLKKNLGLVFFSPASGVCCYCLKGENGQL